MAIKLEHKERITKEKLLALLSEFRKNIAYTGVAFGCITYYVDESGARTVQGKKALQKMTRVAITIGASYEKRVNRDLVRQGEEANFTAQQMSGKEYINDEGVIARDTKTGLKRYLVATIENHTSPDTVYFHEGKRITKEDAIKKELFMPSYFTSKETSGRGNMSEEKDFHTINPNFDNILSITLNKRKYIVIN